MKDQPLKKYKVVLVNGEKFTIGAMAILVVNGYFNFYYKDLRYPHPRQRINKEHVLYIAEQDYSVTEMKEIK